MPTLVRINSVSRHTPSNRRAFTLIEILVAIGIISVLLGILLPAVSAARNAGRLAGCLSNQKQIAVAWGMHSNDNRFFPWDRDRDNDGVDDDSEVYHVWDWGGVNWNGDVAADHYVSDRPLNPYFDAENDLRQHMPVFQCPSDNGLKYSDQVSYPSHGMDGELNSRNTFENPFRNILYGIRGTSYHANEWIWVKPGAVIGFPIARRGTFTDSRTGETSSLSPNFTNRNGLHDVDSPSLFAVTGDAGTFAAGRMGSDRFFQLIPGGDRPGGQMLHDVSWPFNWWHGYQNCTMAFMDGSSRNVKMQPKRGVTDQYTLWMQPRKHQVPGGSATVAHVANRGWDSGVHGDAPAEE